MRYQSTHHFESFEAFNSAPHGWDADFSSTAPSRYRASLQNSAAPGLTINTANFSSATLQRGTTPAGTRTFAVPLQLDAPYLWRGLDIYEESCLLFPEDRELHSVMSGGCEMFTLSVDKNTVDGLLAQWDLTPDVVFATANATRLATGRSQRLKAAITLFSEFVYRHGHHGDYPAFSRGVQEFMLECLLEHMLDDWQGSASISSSVAAKRARRAIDYISGHLAHPLTVTEISEHAGCSRRTLEQSFRRYAGCSPWQFIRQLRLHSCREMLLTATCDTVQDTAARCGFWHMGQFAADYRQMFGERPSETVLQASASRTL